ncbi:DUF3021 domain-containing protein [Pseudalkalibacillus hwajinpoensis]|uniref:DUF3021 domain-containing protein n=1 Tax=Guptibacillus hwajinpoensis TaxID=208199 RepID=A0A4U1MNN6_9BACL|nr:DUF3021 domain-containing protein [Pseudalkalibacillus hwajinpoensis]TKD72242.1 DUF3021 domain-containing protein [Pseudalkalibacillus hwajinpoensis]
MKTFLFRSMVGVFFGGFFAVLLTYSAIFLGDQGTLDSTLFVKNSLGAIFCGWLFSVTPLYFEIRSLNLLQQTALHFCTVMVAYLVIAFGIGWIPQEAMNSVIFVAIALITYTVIWFAFYLYFKHESKKMNEDLQHIK